MKTDKKMVRELSNKDLAGLFILIVLISILLDFFGVLYPINEEVSLLGLLFGIDDSSAVLVLLKLFTTIIYYCCKLFILTGVLNFSINYSFNVSLKKSIIVKTLLIAELVILFSDLLHLLIGNLVFTERLIEYNLFSLYLFFPSSHEVHHISFLLGSVNVFVVIYILALNKLLISETELPSKALLKVVAFSYAIPYSMYVLCNYIVLSNLPK